MKPSLTCVVSIRFWGLLFVGLAGAACVPEAGLLSLVAGNGVGNTNVTTPGQGNGSGTVTTGVPTGSEFVAVSPQVAALRVKNLLTGMAPTNDEYAAVAKDANALDTLVDAWIKTPQYQAKMLVFWADAFQQSQAIAEDFHLSLDDYWFTPVPALLLNFRQSFAKTVAQLVSEGAPFTEVATTRRYMMTTAMMQYLAYSDTMTVGDITPDRQYAPKKNRFSANNGNWNYTFVKKEGQIPIADSANPQSSNYMRFYIPSLGTNNWREDPTVPNQGDKTYCAQWDPVTENSDTSFDYSNSIASWLYAALKGDEYRFFQPGQSQPNSKWCGASPSPSVVVDSDYTDWRMVTIQPATSFATWTKFYDLANLRTTKTINLYQQRVGYFTTPSFFSQWNTNISNQARSTANQTLIVGLAHAFDGRLAVSLTNPPGLNAEHANQPACLACHMNLDPMRQFFRSNWTLTFSSQLDPNQTSLPGTFGFDGVTLKGNSMDDLGKAIATHPRFKLAWAQKLCNWANSTVCDETDPELVRISEVFASSNYDWQVLVKAMFTSPLTTYLAATSTAQNLGVTAPIARRAHLCAALDNRLGLSDSCGQLTLQDGMGGTPYQNLAYSVPKDAYSRGAVDPIFVTQPDLFYRNLAENMCSLVADKVVDTNNAVSFQSSNPSTAVNNIATTLLGLDATRAAPVGAALLNHYNSVKNAGSSATIALKSAFVLACISPYMVSVGQ